MNGTTEIMDGINFFFAMTLCTAFFALRGPLKQQPARRAE
jgi:hypothetical protein